MQVPHHREGPLVMTNAMPAGSPVSGGVSMGAAPDLISGVPDEPPPSAATAEQVVAELYGQHRLRLISTALVLVGDRPTAEDVVQDAFAGLYRAMPRLRDPGKALGYVRASVIN